MPLLAVSSQSDVVPKKHMLSIKPDACGCRTFWPGFSLLTALLFGAGGQAERPSWNAREHTSLRAVGEAAGTGPRSENRSR